MLRLANVQGRQVYTSFGIQYLDLVGVSSTKSNSAQAKQFKYLQCFIERLGRIKNLDLGTLDLESWSYAIKLVDQAAKG